MDEEGRENLEHSTMKIRKATKEDVDGVWEIFRSVISTGDTYVFDPETPKEDLAKHWFAPYMHTFVLETEDGAIAGHIDDLLLNNSITLKLPK